MKTVRQILQAKGSSSTVWIVASDASVREALQLLIDRNVGALPVVDGDHLIGIISERDYVRRLALSDFSLETPVGQIMTTHVCYVRPEQTIDDCMALMTDKHVRHLPVLDNGRLIGLVSIGDVVKNIISHQEFMIAQLENYITGVV